MQKNGGYNLEHACTKNEHGAKTCHLLMQVARLLEALRHPTLSQAQYNGLCAQPIQIPFNSS